ncbi:MAG: sigma-70 family RNA polymerase sigma factor [Polaribacter sp.]|uniref:RNA polymerase sigma factor n=1 Tax=Polaribacter sp. TaxID=1920175 RepID=UPI003BB0A11B
MTEKITFLILECKKNNKKAQIQIYDLFCKAMFYVALKYVKNDEEAKDAMQDGFLKAFSNLDSYEDSTNFGAWLKKIVINICIDKLKKRKIETVSLENYPIEIVNDDDWSFDAKITKTQILEAIEQLNLKYQLVVKLYLLEGYDHEEIAEILKIPIKTSRTHLRRGKLILRNNLKL